LLSLSEGLQELVGPDGLPAARDSSMQLADAVLQLRNVIGTPGDPPISLPPSPNTTLIQAVRASTKVAGITLAGAHKVTGNLEEIAVALGGLAITSGQAAASAGSARAAIELVHQQACVDSVVLDPVQCAALQRAAADAGQAAQSSGQVGLGVGEQAARTKAQAVAVGAITLALKGIVYALALVEKALTQVSLALVSGNTQSPGVYEGLIQLTAGLSATIDGLIALSDGAGKSTEGADELTDGAEDLTDGLDDLSEGADDLAEGTDDLARGAEDLADGGDALADGTQAQAQGTAAVGDALGQLDEGVDSATSGAAQLARGADQLHRDGTSEVLAGIVDASKDPAKAQAYLAASEDRAGDALPYGAPDGAAGRVAYVYTLQGSDTGDGTASTVAGWALLLVIAVAAGSVAWRRLHPLDGAVAEASAPPPPTPASQPEPFAPAEPTPEDTWPFGP
jgi:putative membrane protein